MQDFKLRDLLIRAIKQLKSKIHNLSVKKDTLILRTQRSILKGKNLKKLLWMQQLRLNLIRKPEKILRQNMDSHKHQISYCNPKSQ